MSKKIEHICKTGRNRYIIYNGMTKTLTQWAEYLGINKGTMGNRYYIQKLSIEKCFTKPFAGRGLI